MTEADAREMVATIANTYDGIVEGSKYHKEILNYYNSIAPLPVGYKAKISDPWCAIFVSAMFWVTYGNTLRFPYECSCDRMRALATMLGMWIEDDGYMPKVGDCVLYDWQDNGVGDNKGYPDHVGIVDEVYYDAFRVIEGNCNDKVMHRALHKNNKYIRGFITPDYSALVDSSEKKEDELSDAQKWFLNFGIPCDGRWNDRVEITYAELAEMLYQMTHS